MKNRLCGRALRKAPLLVCTAEVWLGKSLGREASVVPTCLKAEKNEIEQRKISSER